MQQPPRRLAHLAQVADEVIQVVENPHRPLLCAHPRIGQGDAPGGAVQQPRAQGVFEDLDAFADIGRRLVQRLCRASKAALANDREEHPQVIGQRRFFMFRVHSVHGCLVFSRFGEG
ncbi:hypothetical protein D3C76_1461250 [compost metagenome]